MLAHGDNEIERDNIRTVSYTHLDVYKRQGKVASYGQVAELAGNRRWARVVGYALHAVPEDSELPCHRVVTKDGNVSCAFSGGICNRQMELLKKEGVGFIDDHVDMRRFQWSKRLF